MSTKRLTLRTLLAYLDDTLEPTETRSIGEKVQESQTAQEMIKRIKILVRRRRLTTPPFTGPDARFDANTVAEYLDNVLDTKVVSEIEELCREENPAADLYLAEIASSHQILTLILGEPITVPSPAKQRMYGLVKGREAIPFRKPKSSVHNARLPAPTNDTDLDEGSPLLGLTPRKHPWAVWAIPAMAIVLLVGAGLALYLALPQLTEEPHRPRDNNQLVLKDGPSKQDDRKDQGGMPPEKDKKDGGEKEPMTKEPPEKEPMTKEPPEKEPMKKDGGEKEPMTKEPPVVNPPPVINPPVVETPGEASKIKANVATYGFDPKQPTILLQQTEKGWTRLSINAQVSSAEPLVALPGSACALKTNGGANLLMRGFLPRYALPGVGLMTRLLDSSITLHQNSKVAADLTLHRGRLYLSNEAQPATVIVRFWKETWVITLTEPNSEVGIDLISRYTPQINFLDGEEPLAEAYFLVLKGGATLKVDTFEYPNLTVPPGPSFYAWNNKGPRMPAPQSIPAQSLNGWVKEPPATKEAQAMGQAVQELARATVQAGGGNKSITTVLKEMRAGQNLSDRLLAIYCLSAIDQIPELLDALGDEDPTHMTERDEATYSLRLWISRDARHNLMLYNHKEGKGILTEKGFPPTQAQVLVSLLHGLTNSQDQSDDLKLKLGALLGYMRNDRCAIRHVAHYLFDALTPTIMGKPAYNAAHPLDQRNAAVMKLQEMLDAGQLTPMPMPTRPGSAPGTPMPPRP